MDKAGLPFPSHLSTTVTDQVPEMQANEGGYIQICQVTILTAHCDIGHGIAVRSGANYILKVSLWQRMVATY